MNGWHPKNIENLNWLSSPDIKPYVYMRAENLFKNPGTKQECNWFGDAPIYKDPLRMDQLDFGNQILTLESAAFNTSGMAMPRWVFYDCAIVPGLVCGFAMRQSAMSETMKADLKVNPTLEWVPLSLFIIIPTVRHGEWVAHNLCTSNSLVGETDMLYALGFLTKAFGLWYANVDILCGMTQWKSPSIRLHSHYGSFQILTAYTPIHSYARTLTYRCKVDTSYWPAFFDKKSQFTSNKYKKTDYNVDPKNDESLIRLQNMIENGQGPFYLSPSEIRTRPLDAELSLYHLA
jgi:hypothetical protein